MSIDTLSGKLALITGAGRGIGQATAIALAKLGANVALAARTLNQLEETAALIRAHGVQVQAFPVDLSDREATWHLAEQIESRLGSINILVNNAGIVGPFGPTWTLDPLEWETALNVNLLAPFLLARSILPGMLASHWGRIISVSSGVVNNPRMRGGAYAASKAGLDAWTRQLGFELEGTGVTISAIYPGAVDTAMSASVRAQEPAVVGQISQIMRDAVAAGKMPGPEYPARLIAAMLIADDPALNGQIVDINSESGKKLLNLVTVQR